MNWKHLLYIVPAVLAIGIIYGLSVGWNIVADKCNAHIKYSEALNKIECQYNERALDMWQLYEERCPQVYNDILANKINLTKEFDRMDKEALK